MGKKIKTNKMKNKNEISFNLYSNKEIKKKLGKKALKFVKKNKIVVAPLPIFIQKKGFIAYRQPSVTIGKKKKTAIFLDKKLKKEKRELIFWHEAGHHKIKKILKPTIRKKIHEEVKNLEIYKLLRKQGYTPKQIPEEILVERFAKYKTGKLKTEVAKKFKIFKKTFKKLTNGGKKNEYK